MSQVSLGRPEFVPGTPPGYPTAKFLYVIFLYRFFFSLHTEDLCKKDPCNFNTKIFVSKVGNPSVNGEIVLVIVL